MAGVKDVLSAITRILMLQAAKTMEILPADSDKRNIKCTHVSPANYNQLK